MPRATHSHRRTLKHSRAASSRGRGRGGVHRLPSSGKVHGEHLVAHVQRSLRARHPVDDQVTRRCQQLMPSAGSWHAWASCRPKCSSRTCRLTSTRPALQCDLHQTAGDDRETAIAAHLHALLLHSSSLPARARLQVTRSADRAPWAEHLGQSLLGDLSDSGCCVLGPVFVKLSVP